MGPLVPFCVVFCSPTDEVPDKENYLATIERGRDALQKFQALRARAKASTKLKVVPTPRIALGTIPVINTGPTFASVESSEHVADYSRDQGRSRVGFVSPRAGARALAAANDVVDLTQTTNSLPPAPLTDGSCAVQQTSYTGLDDDADSLFGHLDVDALVANYQRTQQRNDRVAPPKLPMSDESVSSDRSIYSSVSKEDTAGGVTTEELCQTIKQTRENLRKVREECDDASLEGDVPDVMQKRRSKLELELEQLCKRYRECKGTAKVSLLSRNVSPVHAEMPQTYSSRLDAPNKNPTCSCGMKTVEARVQHGSNANRLYYRCSTCGFNSWVDGEVESREAYSNERNQARQIVVEQPCVSSDPGVASNMLRAKRVLRDVFGHNAFRPNQERTVMEAFSGRDVFVLMPTGGGKSLCFQLPACIDNGVTIVISPLVSLIQDQVQQLEALDVGVANLKSDQDYDSVQRPIISELFSNRITIKMLYVTPEKIASSNLLNNLFESLEKRSLLARFVIDEAHCISQWGHDFRKDYMNLGTLRSKFPSVSVCVAGSCFVINRQT